MHTWVHIYKLGFCFYNFHIFRFSWSGKGEVDVYRFMSNIVQITMCFVVTIPCHTSPSMFIMYDVDAYNYRFYVTQRDLTLI